MKKLFLLAVITVSGLVNSIQAQDIDYGLKAGLNISNLSDGEDETNNLIAFHVGAFAEISLSEKFALQPELLYSRQGAQNDDIDVKLKLDYLAIPIMAKYYLSDKLSIEVGPQVSFLLKDKVDFDDSDIPDLEADASSVDFGFNIGFGIDFNKNLFAQIRYNLGATAVIENPDVNTRLLQISLGCKF